MKRSGRTRGSTSCCSYPLDRVLARYGSLGVRFPPDWPALLGSVQQAEEWLFAYAAGVIDCELAGGFGIDLRYD